MVTMTPSTSDEIDTAVCNYRALLIQYQQYFPPSVLKTVLRDTAFTKEQFEVLRRRVEEISKIAVRTAAVDLALTAKKAIARTGRRAYLDADVVAGMRRVGTEKQVVIRYVNPMVALTPRELDAWIQKRYPGERLADPFELCAHIETDSTFADTHPCATQWWDKDGNCCCLVFLRWGREPSVNVMRNANGWHSVCWWPLVHK